MNLKTIAAPVLGAFMLAACSSSDDTSTASDTTASSSTQSQTAGTFGSYVQQQCQGADRVFFDFDRSDLSPQARSTIECWANWMDDNPSARITIEGHADERGTREYNLALGDRRANSVQQYLQALGASNPIQTISYGKERPADPGHDEAAWAKNRRAVAVVAGPSS